MMFEYLFICILHQLIVQIRSEKGTNSSCECRRVDKRATYWV